MLLYHIGSRTTISPREKLLISSGGWGISGWWWAPYRNGAIVGEFGFIDKGD